MPATAGWLEIDPYVYGLEQAHAAGGPVDVAAFVPSPTHPLHDAILTELLRVDLELCWGRAVPRTAAELIERFPRCRQLPDTVRHLAFEEYRARRHAGEDPDPDSYRRRFGVDTSGWPTGASGSEHLRRETVDDLARPTPVLPGPIVDDPLFQHSVSALDRASCHGLSEALSLLSREESSFLQYELVRELGAGAFGRVYLARQPELADRLVVLKIAADLGGEPATLARLQHTNIVPVYAVHRRRPLQAFCMPYHGSTTFADLLRELRKRTASPESGAWFAEYLANRQSDGTVEQTGALVWFREASHVDATVRLFSRLVDGLAYAHARGVLHLDLKPANILVADDGEPMLLDFNLASDAVLRRTAPAAYVGGTLPYMSPQRLAALRDGRSHESAADDVYALGLILAEMLTGQPTPVSSERTLQAVVLDLIRARAVPFADVRTVNPRIPPSVAAIVAKCIHPDPARRYHSAADLAEDLRRHLADLPLRYAGNPSFAERVGKWRRRHPRLASAYTAAGLAVAIAAGFAFAFDARSRQLGTARHERERAEFLSDYETARLVLADPTADLGQTRRGLEIAGRAVAQVDPRADGDLVPVLRELHLLAGRGHRVLSVQAADPAERSASAAEAERLSTLVGGLEAAPTGESARELRHRAAAEMDRHEYRRAADLLLRATREEPADPMGWFLLGACRDRLRQPTEAAAAYTVVIALRPRSAVTYYRRAAAHSEAKRWADAITDFDGALRLDSDFGAAILDRGLAKRASGDDRGAEADFTRVLELPVPPTRVYFLRSSVRAKLGDRDGAAADWQHGVTLLPTDELSWISSGVAKLTADPKGALADFDAALKLNPDSAKALENKAHVLAERLSRPDEAIRVLDHAVETNPDYELARAGRGVLLARVGKRTAAVADVEAAMKLSTSPLVRYQAACVFALASKDTPADRAEAIRLLGIAVEGGFGADLLTSDPDLAPLRGTDEFTKLLARLKAVK